MKKWIEEADWTAIPGVMAKDTDIKNNMHRDSKTLTMLGQLNPAHVIYQ
jgi:hypothetical protein